MRLAHQLTAAAKQNSKGLLNLKQKTCKLNKQMAKGKMPPQLLEYFKKKVGKGDDKDTDKEEKGKKAEESAKKGLKAAKAAKNFKDKKEDK